jgi:hypothetical protein
MQPFTKGRESHVSGFLNRSQRPRRAAVFVESIIVISMLTLLFGGILFFHSLYGKKIAGYTAARGAAWELALKGCNPDLPFDELWRAVVKHESGNAPPLEGAFMVGHEAGKQTASTQAPTLLGGKRYQLNSSVQFACDERPASPRGDMLDLMIYAAKNLFPTF